MKKFPATIELTNLYPEWTKIRSDDQSNGFLLLNALTAGINKMDQSLITQGLNSHLVTANLNEIDLLYKVILPPDFEWQLTNSDPLNTIPALPSVTGYINLVPYPVVLAEQNNIESLWYASIPNRVSTETTVSGIDYILHSFQVSSGFQEVELSHHLDGGKLLIECSGGSQYFKIENNVLVRGKILLEGVTRKGTVEQEEIIFPWDMKQWTLKEWTKITRIKTFDLESNVTITVKSADFNNTPHKDFYNLAWSQTRNKIDTFWDLGLTVSGNHSLDLLEYTTDEWQDLLNGFIDKEVVQSWELLDLTFNNITSVDLALEPFSNRAWVLTNNKKLLCYDLSDETISGVDLLRSRTHGAHVDFDYISRYLTRGETFVFTPIHSRPLQEIIKYRIWYQTPTGNKYGLLDGSSVSFASNFWVTGQQLQKRITDKISIVLSELGEYLFSLEVEFMDGTKHYNSIIVKTLYKTPLTSLDLSSLITPTVSGLSFDSDQKLWVIDNNQMGYQINLHTDIMLLDFDSRTFYFKEKYDEVDINYDNF